MATLENYNPATAGKYDPGQIVILFDHRQSGPQSSENQMSTFQSYWLDGLYRLGWPSWQTPEFEAGNLRLIWYTHAGNEGTRDYPLYRANTVKEMFDSLSDEGFRPMILGYSGENPFPMIGGTEPPPEPKKKNLQPKVAKGGPSGGMYYGHGGKAGTTPHERVMAIIDNEEEKEARKRKEEVERARRAEDVSV